METLKNAPIIEALAQINFERPAPISDVDFKKYKSANSALVAEDILQFQVSPTNAQVVPFGVKLGDSSSNEILQFTSAFFAYSQTGKYASWDTYKPAMERRIGEFLGLVNPTNVNRLALRFINQFPLTCKFEQLDRFLRTRPLLGGFPGILPESSLLQFTLPMSTSEVRANVGLRVNSGAADSLTVVLDIDVFKSGQFKPSMAELSAEFDKLRTEKNRVFESCLTPEAIKQFT